MNRGLKDGNWKGEWKRKRVIKAERHKRRRKGETMRYYNNPELQAAKYLQVESLSQILRKGGYRHYWIFSDILRIY